MFTGIIQEIGKVRSTMRQSGNLVLQVEGRKAAPLLKIGDSVSINGACQTVIAKGYDSFQVEAIAETLSRTNFGLLSVGAAVNLELPLGLSDLLHGHLVQGHIDCAFPINEIKPLDGSVLYTISYPQEFSKLLVEKGSIAVDGVSLTVVKVLKTAFQVSMIRHTISNTNFSYRKVGDIVNLEFDMIAKYIQKMISPYEDKLSIEYLKEHGF
jgi:riboflavin synthase